MQESLEVEALCQTLSKSFDLPAPQQKIHRIAKGPWIKNQKGKITDRTFLTNIMAIKGKI